MIWAYHQSIKGFKHRRLVIFINGTFLYSKYNGCILCATRLDENNHDFALALTIMDFFIQLRVVYVLPKDSCDRL